jgi:hypothetical protein
MPDSSHLSATDDEQVTHFERAWEAGEQPRLADYLVNEVGPVRVNRLIRLIRIDLTCRYPRSGGLRLERYLAEWPELRDNPEALRELLRFEYELRQRHGEHVSTAELAARLEALGLGTPTTAMEAFPKTEGSLPPASPSVAAGPSPSAEVFPETEGSLPLSGQPPEREGLPTTSQAGIGTGLPPMLPPLKFGRYRMYSRLGEGGFGTVYLGYDEQLFRPVAIKVPRKDRLRNAAAVEDFLREARSAARLSHPAIVAVFDAGKSADGCYIISDYITGHSLAERLGQDRVPAAEAATLLARVAEALHFAHAHGIIHRDVKPNNILLDARGRPHVLDFGLAVWANDHPEEDGRIVGTPQYMAPEQVRGEGHRIDERVDIYALGVVFYQLLCGRLPFRGPTLKELVQQILYGDPPAPRSLDPAIPQEMERICQRAMARRAADRYETAAAMAEDLLLAAAAPPDAAPAPPQSAPELGDGPALGVVPKGLRSFEAADADFFLELLPGPRDRAGLPDLLRFWKARLEARDPAETFPVGLVYGPSGCGKSSFVKAGLLPRLAPHVVPVYLEATAEGTESRLLAALHRACPDLRGCADLPDLLRQVRRGRGLARGRKLCIVIDQFEQWLQGRACGDDLESGAAALLEALRQADGASVTCVLMVRDDFWVSVSRLFGQLEVPLVEGGNARLVDLFDQRHARKVLELFGRAYGCLPPQAEKLAAEHEAFLEQAVRALSEQGRVICVRLSLFADMMKGRAWTPATLAEVGGIEGIGVTFLEETFSSRAAPAEHRLHQQAARNVLRHLLPERGTDIKRMVAREELL